ncbi:Hint domain-containing protein [uncultured Roseovarius sp.]|uniref:Hint domain-containing protein n=1 Tax=uncultured Roseovarius sp. TaxID=293344 RepID=UPI00262592D9|nr:Hint domain-containing protein [uncultured Roseovarius sp.]
MPTTYNDQFFVMDPGNPPAGGTALTKQNFDFIDQNDDGIIDTSNGDTFNGLTITRVWVGDTITVTMGGVNVTITGVTFYVSGGPAVFTPTDGTVLEDATFISSTFVNSSTQIPVGSFGPPCFTRGTLIATPDGDRLIEDLKPGDLVLTLDNGPQPLLLVSCKTFPATGRNAPVHIAKGALGNNADLLVSQQHRILIGDWRAELFFGVEQVLVAAKHMCNDDTIRICPGEDVEYFHLLFDQHQIVWAAGIPSESYFPGYAANQADQDTRAEIDRLFPDLAEKASDIWVTARPVARQFEAALLN